MVLLGEGGGGVDVLVDWAVSHLPGEGVLSAHEV